MWITRKVEFSASHVCASPALSEGFKSRIGAGIASICLAMTSGAVLPLNGGSPVAAWNRVMNLDRFDLA